MSYDIELKRADSSKQPIKKDALLKFSDKYYFVLNRLKNEDIMEFS